MYPALWADNLRLSDLEQRFVCTVCGHRGADVRPLFDGAHGQAGAAALSKFGGYDTSLRWVSGDDDDSGAAWQRVRLQAFIDSGGRIRL